jgi:hypothetical protein
MIDKTQLRELIEETLKDIGLYSTDAVNLVQGTIAQESAGGKYIRQIKGPALGICQMEPFTFSDHFNWLSKHKWGLFNRIIEACGTDMREEDLRYNLKLSIAMCRVHYRRRPEPLPNSIDGYAAYWKRWYNTYLGAGTEKEFINNYKKYVL